MLFAYMACFSFAYLSLSAGTGALSVNAQGNNTAFGFQTLNQNTTGSDNTAFGSLALNQNTTSRDNTAFGSQALRDNTNGLFNTAVGRSALQNNTTGGFNIAIGNLAGLNHTSGSNNIVIDHLGVAAEAFTIRIGTAQTRTFIAGIRDIMTQGDALAVVIDNAGQLGTISSSRRYKEQIHDMAAASERLLNLRPVTFRYKNAFEDGDKPIQFGLIAEEVAEVFPELVVFNEDRTPESVKYRLLSTLLLNELQKEYRVNQRQEAQLKDMQARLEHLETAKAGASANIQ